jgi:hypothetical protein
VDGLVLNGLRGMKMNLNDKERAEILAFALENGFSESDLDERFYKFAWAVFMQGFESGIDYARGDKNV